MSNNRETLQTVTALMAAWENRELNAAARLLADWDDALTRLCRVMPRDYQRVLTAARSAEREGRDVHTAVMSAASG